MFFCFNNKISKEQSEEIQISPFLNVTLFGLSVFETLRTYHQQIFELNHHLDRLFKSLDILEITLNFSNNLNLRSEILARISELLVLNKKVYPDENFRIKIFVCQDFYWIKFTKLINPNPKIYQEGVLVAEDYHERIFPNAKYPNPAYPIFMNKVKKLNVAYCIDAIIYAHEEVEYLENITI